MLTRFIKAKKKSSLNKQASLADSSLWFEQPMSENIRSETLVLIITFRYNYQNQKSIKIFNFTTLVAPSDLINSLASTGL